MKIAAGLLYSLAFLAPCARGQVSPLAPAPQPNEACIQRVPGAAARPEYPEESLQNKERGTVRVEMEFVDAQSPPRVRTLGTLGEVANALAKSAEKFARDYRHTCMKPGDAPVTVRQDFVFVPNDGRKVVWTEATAESRYGPAESEPPLDCVQHVAPSTRPEFPRRAARDGKSGRVVLRMDFGALKAEPTITVLASGPRPEFAQSASEWARGYRLTCGPLPLGATQSFVFQLEGTPSPAYTLRDTDLKTFVSASRNALAKPVYFDLNTMGCPFDVRMHYWQPFFRNRVGEVGQARPERRPFLDWLAGLQLDINEAQAAGAAGEPLTITVPCGKIDL
jgi:outer membrane biosynthesis protein TonB